MVTPLIVNKRFYQSTEALNKENIMKLFTRAHKMYAAKSSVDNVLKSIFEVEISMKSGSDVWRVLQDQKNKGKLEP